MAGAAERVVCGGAGGNEPFALTNQALPAPDDDRRRVGFYLDRYACRALPTMRTRPGRRWHLGRKIDTPGTASRSALPRAFSAFACVGVIVLRHDPHLDDIDDHGRMVVGVAMQIIAEHDALLRPDRPQWPCIRPSAMSSSVSTRPVSAAPCRTSARGRDQHASVWLNRCAALAMVRGESNLAMQWCPN